MNERTRLNQQHYQQAVRFAENFSSVEKNEFLHEINARNAFEQSHILQKKAQSQPFVRKGIALLTLVFGVCATFYWQTQRWQTVNTTDQTFQAFQQQQSEMDSNSHNARYILHLQNQLRANPITRTQERLSLSSTTI